jgi:uncharacterized protein (TIGR02145 family)
LKSTSGWSRNNGTNEFGFSALAGGSRNMYGSFDNAGLYGLWWSATEYGASYAWYRYMYYISGSVTESYGDKGLGFSVRCVR